MISTVHQHKFFWGNFSNGKFGVEAEYYRSLKVDTYLALTPQFSVSALM
jgi:hypothetical protein